MLHVAAMQGMILVQQIRGCSQLVVKLAVDISLKHGDTHCKTEFLLCAFLLLLATLHCKQKPAASTGMILFYIRLPIESILSLIVPGSITVWWQPEA